MSLERFWSVDHINKHKPSVYADNGIKKAELPFPDIEPPSFSLGLDDSEKPMADTFVKDSESSSDEEGHFNLRIRRRRHTMLHPPECKKYNDISDCDWQNVDEQTKEETKFLSSTQLASNSCLKRLRRGTLAACSQPLKHDNDMFEKTERTPLSKRSEYPATPELIIPTIRPGATNAVQSFVGIESRSQMQGESRIFISDDDIEECSSEDEVFHKALRMPGVRSTPSLRPSRKPHVYEHLQSFSDTRRGSETSFLPASTSFGRPVMIQKSSIGTKEVKFENTGRYISRGGLKEDEKNSSWNKNLFESFAAEMDEIQELEEENYGALRSETGMLGDRKELQKNFGFQFLNETNDTMHSERLQEFSEANASVTEEMRIAALLRKRLPHFTSIDALPSCAEPIFINYREQFGSHPDTNLTPLQSTQVEQVHNLPRKRPRNNHGGKYKVKEKHATENRRVRRKREAGSQAFVQSHTQSTKASSSENMNMISGTAQASKRGYWLTERSGSRTYVTRDGARLGGSMAYKQYLKENGRSKKAKARKRK